MRNDFAFGRNFCSCSFRAFSNRIINKIAGLSANGLRGGNDGIDHGTDRAGKFLVLLNNRASGSNGPASFMTHDNNEVNAEMFGSVFDRSHCRCVDHVAGISGDKEFAHTKPTKQQLRWNAAVGARNNRCPWRLRLSYMFAQR